MAALVYADFELSVRSSLPGLVGRAAAAAVFSAAAGARPSQHPAAQPPRSSPGPLGPTPCAPAAQAPLEAPTARSALLGNGAADGPRSPPA